MTNYTDVISLERAKLYLKVDAGQTETDNEITSMINSSLSFIEKRTNHIFKTKEKVYFQDCALVNQVKVYDYPIDNTETEYDIIYRPLYAIVPTVDNTVTLTIGYTNVEDIPNELIDAALQIIKVWFYESEKHENTTLIPISVLQVIDANKRFL
jgi:hypothetical protein